MGYKCCTECSQKCLLIHGKRDPSPIAVSFFKVLVDDRFTKFLFIPPKFACSVCSMLGEKAYLEDSNGRRWSVRLSTIDGSLAFRQGWDEFASDHFLKIGQFLIFTYIIGSHFVVQIYDESGCEKLNFPLKLHSGGGKKANPKLSSDHLPSDSETYVPKEAPSFLIDRGSRNEQGSNSTSPSASNIEIINSAFKDAQKTEMAGKKASLCHITQERPKSQPAVDHEEVPFYIIDRDNMTEQGETRTSHFDLSSFEMFRDKSGAGQMEEASVAIGKKHSPYHEKEKRNPDMPNIVCELGARHNTINLGSRSAVKPKMEEIPLVGSSGSVPQIVTKMSACFDVPVVLEMEKGKKVRVIKEEFEEKVNLSTKDKEKAYKPVKIEPKDSDDLSAPNLIKFCYSVTAVTQSWLELPTVSRKGKPKMERKIVLLRDSAGRVWPVLYQERCEFRGLTSGWKAFAKANNIQPGDVCLFGVENQSEGLLRVNIVRNEQLLPTLKGLLAPKVGVAVNK
ncbi:uncharacterized protein LOC122081552 isoform X2 [Macadamia integrifolia]|uniref:uncharacterized protein LOC122081552 isoform X2 n=1 Tax=Macadamia integrifolia TaxID=60698 RepID=UPI001C4E4AEB|nr:uncharacterized protein LOC122081552 isoform X2 [Macadamia integrifolia]